MEKRVYYGRFPKYVRPKIDECEWGDGQIVYLPDSADPLFGNIGFVWIQLLIWVTDIRNINRRKKDSAEFQVGNIIIPYIADHDAFAVKQIIKIYLPAFRAAFMTPDMPRELREFIIGLLGDDWREVDEDRRVKPEEEWEWE